MLQSMRQLAQSWVVKGLMALLIVSFGIWGIGDIFRGNPLQKTVAKVGDRDINVQDLNHKFAEMLAQARRTVNPDMTEAEAKRLGLLDKTLEGEVKRALVDQDMARLGIAVDPQAVLKLLAEQPQFRNKDGSFNKDMFRELVERQGTSERGFIAQAQQDMARQVLVGALAGSPIVPQMETDALYKARAQKRVLDVVTIDPAKLPGIATPDDKTLRDYYDKNPALFTAPEYRGITVGVLSTDELAKNTTVSDEDLKKEYDAKKDELANPEQRDLTQVVVQDEAKAKELAQKARASGDLATAAKQAGDNPVPLDKMEEKNLLPELAKPVFALAAGQVADPVKTQLGWHVIQIKKITPAGIPGFEDIKDSLRADMQRDRAVETATRNVNQLDDALAAGRPLDEIAPGLGLRLVKLTEIDNLGMTPAGKEPEELPNKETVLKDAFAQNAGDTSPVESDKDGNYYVVRTDEVTPAALKPFEEVKPMVVTAWKIREQGIKAQTVADDVAKELREGKPLSGFAGRDGLSTRVSLPLSQLGDTDPLLPQDIVPQVFKIKKGETAISIGQHNMVVARVAQLIDADANAADPRKNTIAGQIRQNRNAELLDEYVQHLYDVFPVKIDNALLDQLRQQDN